MDPNHPSWKVICRLGEGGMGEVYKALSPDGKPVAVKILNESQKSQLPLFEQEAKLLTQLRHPAIASVLGYSTQSEMIFGEEKGPCFWMEYVDGEDLLTAAVQSPPEEILEWFRQALEALQFLHSQSILHGDLSPRNILIDRKGRLKLLDFGLATSFLGSAKFNAGTLPYLAPERVYGKNLPASDLFSLGTLFYEALSGSHPRAHCRSLQEMIRTKAKPLLEAAPALVSHFNLPSRVIDRMIETDLKDRFGQAREALDALSGGSFEKKAAPSEYYPARMWGAEEAFQRVGEKLKNLPAHSLFLFLHGITGVGKKRFIREIAFQCALSGIKTHEISPRWFKSVWQSLRSEIFSEPHAFFFHDLDRLPLSELALLLRPDLSPRNLLAVFEWNDDGLNEDKRRLLQNLSQKPGDEEIRLQNLNREQTFSFLEAALGTEAASVGKEELWRQTQGNPRMLLEMVHAFQEMQLTRKKHLSKEWIQRISHLHSFEDLLLERLQSISPEEKRLLLLLAVAHFPAGFNLLEEAAGKASASGESLKSSLDALTNRRLLLFEKETGEFRLATSGLETTLLQGVPLEEQMELHNRWKLALENREGHEEQKLHHALSLRDANSVALWARRVTETLREKGETLEALDLIQKSLELIYDPSENSRLLRVKANLLNELGRFEEALRACDEIIALGAPDESVEIKQLKYWIVTGRILQNMGRHEEAAKRFLKGMELGKKLSETEALPYFIHTHSLLGMHELRAGRLEKSKEHISAGLKLAGDDDPRRAELLRNLSAVWAEEGKWEEVESSLNEAKDLYRKSGSYSGEFATLLQEGNLRMEKGDADGAECAYREAVRLAQTNDDELNLATVWNNLGVLYRRRGNLEQALQNLSRAYEIFRALGSPGDLAQNLAQLAMAQTAVGQFSTAREHLQKLAEAEGESPSPSAREAENFLLELKEGKYAPLQDARPPDPLFGFWNQELALRFLAREAKDEKAITEILKRFYEKLPVSLKVSFEDRADYRKWFLKK
ncbi:MAG: serine/threonine-protein kinase [bacterium]